MRFSPVAGFLQVPPAEVKDRSSLARYKPRPLPAEVEDIITHPARHRQQGEAEKKCSNGRIIECSNEGLIEKWANSRMIE